jgi:hypothetical protein
MIFVSSTVSKRLVCICRIWSDSGFNVRASSGTDIVTQPVRKAQDRTIKIFLFINLPKALYQKREV